MTEKDKASPRQRVIMEQRWAKAREDCPAGTCVPASRFHVAGCERRQQKVKVTNLNTGVISEATIVHSDFRAVKDVLDQHEKQAVRLEPGVVVVKDVNDLTQDELDEMARVKNEGGVLLIPEEMHFSQEYWDRFEKGHPAARYTYGGVAEQMPAAEQEQRYRELVSVPEAPARPWWKFWGRRG